MCRVSPEASFPSSLRHRSPASHDDPKQPLWARSLHTTLRFPGSFLIPARSSVKGNAICNASSGFLQEAQNDTSNTSPPAWPAPGKALIGKLSLDLSHRAFNGICISHMPRFGAPSSVALCRWRSQPRSPRRSRGNAPGPPTPGHSSCAYVVLLARRLAFEGRVSGVDSY